MSATQATIYVVDDDASVRQGLARLIRAAGWNVETFDSADGFLERDADSTVTGCVVLDVNMPGMSGLDLQEWLRAQGQTHPVVFLTGHGDVPTSVLAMKNGAVDFLLKPVDGEVLLRAIEQAIRQDAIDHEQDEQRRAIKARLARLSLREHEVMEYVVNGYMNKQIAAELGIAEKTVKVHRGRVMEKVEVGSVAELVHLYESVLLPPSRHRG